MFYAKYYADFNKADNETDDANSFHKLDSSSSFFDETKDKRNRYFLLGFLLNASHAIPKKNIPQNVYCCPTQNTSFACFYCDKVDFSPNICIRV